MTLLDKWMDFEARCVHPHNRGKNEVENMRRCFYSGAVAALSLLEVVDTDKDDGGIGQIRSLMNELNDFHRGITDKLSGDRQGE